MKQCMPKIVYMAYSEKHLHSAYSKRLKVCKTYLMALMKLADFRIFPSILYHILHSKNTSLL